MLESKTTDGEFMTSLFKMGWEGLQEFHIALFIYLIYFDNT